MSDPQDEIDILRDASISMLLCAINDTGGLVTEEVDGLGPCLVPKGDTEREWTGLAGAYLAACKATGEQPLIDGKRAPCILKITVQVGRSVSDDISDEENNNETHTLHGLFESLPDDVEVAVVDKDGVYLYDAHREV
jgi:hypothetical protein